MKHSSQNKLKLYQIIPYFPEDQKYLGGTSSSGWTKHYTVPSGYTMLILDYSYHGDRASMSGYKELVVKDSGGSTKVVIFTAYVTDYVRDGRLAYPQPLEAYETQEIWSYNANGSLRFYCRYLLRSNENIWE